MLRYVIILFFLSTIFSISLFSEEYKSDFIIASIIDSRQKLISGEYTCSGSSTSNNRETGTSTNDIEIYSAFDFSTGKLRFDRQEGNNLIKGRNPKKLDSQQVGGKCAIHPDKVLVWINGDSATAIYPTNHKISGLVRPMDIRIVGLALHLNYYDYSPFDKSLDRLKNVYFGQTASVRRLDV
jgi:hypothetical protein